MIDDARTTATADILLGWMPACESRLTRGYVAISGRQPVQASRHARHVLNRLRNLGRCDYRETRSKDGTRVLRREWFKVMVRLEPDPEFAAFLERASKIVATWPAWKRNALGASSRAFNDTPRP